MIREMTEKLISRNDLSAGESRAVVDEIMSGQTSPVQTAAFLTALRQKGETSEEILGAAQVMRERVCRIPHHQERLFDNCGTGGDGAGTFNISTTAAFVIAACGVAVGKHGNRSISSKCGSADLLQMLGANITMAPEQVGKCIDEVGIGFLFAPSLHPAMKEVAPVRKELGFRTVFNLLGPLTNPAFASHQLIGVFDGRYTERIAEVASGLGVKRTMVVYNLRNIDELTTAGTNRISFADNGVANTYELKPEEYGFPTCAVEDLGGGTAGTNTEITLAILKGEKGAGRDTVVLNAAAALMVAEKTENIRDGIAIAAECIDSGKALEKLHSFVEFTRKH